MKYFIWLILFGAFLNAEECLDYDENRLIAKSYLEFGNFARLHMVETMKDYGFGICLEYYDLDSKRKEREMDHLRKTIRLIEKRALRNHQCIITSRGEKMKEEVENYVVNYKKKSIEAIKSVLTEDKLKEVLESPPLLRKCLSLYNSKEYQDEVKRIVKKYCKECE